MSLSQRYHISLIAAPELAYTTLPTGVFLLIGPGWNSCPTDIRPSWSPIAASRTGNAADYSYDVIAADTLGDSDRAAVERLASETGANIVFLLAPTPQGTRLALTSRCRPDKYQLVMHLGAMRREAERITRQQMLETICVAACTRPGLLAWLLTSTPDVPAEAPADHVPASVPEDASPFCAFFPDMFDAGGALIGSLIGALHSPEPQAEPLDGHEPEPDNEPDDENDTGDSPQQASYKALALQLQKLPKHLTPTKMMSNEAYQNIIRQLKDKLSTEEIIRIYEKIIQSKNATQALNFSSMSRLELHVGPCQAKNYNYEIYLRDPDKPEKKMPLRFVRYGSHIIYLMLALQNLQQRDNAAGVNFRANEQAFTSLYRKFFIQPRGNTDTEKIFTGLFQRQVTGPDGTDKLRNGEYQKHLRDIDNTLRATLKRYHLDTSDGITLRPRPLQLNTACFYLAPENIFISDDLKKIAIL